MALRALEEGLVNGTLEARRIAFASGSDAIDRVMRTCVTPVLEQVQAHYDATIAAMETKRTTQAEHYYDEYQRTYRLIYSNFWAFQRQIQDKSTEVEELTAQIVRMRARRENPERRLREKSERRSSIERIENDLTLNNDLRGRISNNFIQDVAASLGREDHEAIMRGIHRSIAEEQQAAAEEEAANPDKLGRIDRVLNALAGRVQGIERGMQGLEIGVAQQLANVVDQMVGLTDQERDFVLVQLQQLPEPESGASGPSGE